MKREQVTTELAERLRRQGLRISPKELDAFLASLPPESSVVDAESLVQQYLKQGRDYRSNARLSRFTLICVLTGLFFVTSGLLALTFGVPHMVASGADPEGAFLYGVTMAPLGLIMVVCGASPLVRLWMAQRAARARNANNEEC